MEIKQIDMVDLLKASLEKMRVPMESCALLNQCELLYILRTGGHLDLISSLKTCRFDFLTVMKISHSHSFVCPLLQERTQETVSDLLAVWSPSYCPWGAVVKGWALLSLWSKSHSSLPTTFRLHSTADPNWLELSVHIPEQGPGVAGHPPSPQEVLTQMNALCVHRSRSCFDEVSNYPTRCIVHLELMHSSGFHFVNRHTLIN